MGMRLSAREAQRISSKARKLQNFGRAWNVGDKGIVLYPIFKDEETGVVDLLVSKVWGYKVNDVKALGVGASFIPSTVEIDDNGKPVTPDLPYQFSFLAGSFVAGEKNARIAAIDAKPWPSNSAYKAALDALNDEYDVKNNPKARKPIISRLQLYISTEVVYIPIVNEKPDWDNAGLYAYALSKDRITKLLAILDDPQYAVDVNEGYMEIQYNFVAADNEKSTAGRTAPIGVVPEYRLKNRFPDDVKKLAERVSMLPEDSDIIANHNYSYSKVDPIKLKNALSNYSMMNSECLDSVAEDEYGSLMKSAALIKELSVFNALKNDKLKDELDKAIAEAGPTIADIAPNYAAAQAAVDPSVPPTIQALSNPALASDSDIDDLNDVSLD